MDVFVEQERISGFSPAKLEIRYKIQNEEYGKRKRIRRRIKATTEFTIANQKQQENIRSRIQKQQRNLRTSIINNKKTHKRESRQQRNLRA